MPFGAIARVTGLDRSTVRHLAAQISYRPSDAAIHAARVENGKLGRQVQLGEADPTLLPRLRALVEGGASFHAAAVHCGVHHVTARNLLLAAGVAEPARRDVAVALKALVERERLTLSEAGARLGIHRGSLHRMAKRVGIASHPDAQRRARSAAGAKGGSHIDPTSRIQRFLALLRADPTLPILSAARQVGITSKSWPYQVARAHGLARLAPAAPKQPERKSVAEQRQASAVRAVLTVMERMTVNRSAETVDTKAARERAVEHARRTAPLAPPSQTEAERLVAEFIARRGVTRLPMQSDLSDTNNMGLGWRSRGGLV